MPDPGPLQSSIPAALAQVRERIARAAVAAGRRADSVRLLPVSKTFPADAIRIALHDGCPRFGENRVQEAMLKEAVFASEPEPRPEWAIIGHLQTNKAKHVARIATEFQALDSAALAETLQRRLDAEDRALDVLIEVKTSADPAKTGVAPGDVLGLVGSLAPLPRLRLRGLMTVATHTDDETEVRRCFRTLARLLPAVRDAAPDPERVDELSMGMSGDFEVAIDEGATVVRIGRGIFGARDYGANPPRLG